MGLQEIDDVTSSKSLYDLLGGRTIVGTTSFQKSMDGTPQRYELLA